MEYIEFYSKAVKIVVIGIVWNIILMTTLVMTTSLSTLELHEQITPFVLLHLVFSLLCVVLVFLAIITNIVTK